MFIKKSSIIYIFAISLFIITTMLSNTMWIHIYGDSFEKVLKFIRYGSYLTCLFQIINIEFNRKDFYKILLFTGCTCICSYISTNKTVFLYVFLFVAAYKMIPNLIINVFLFIQSSLLTIIIISSQIGINIDYIFGVGERNRHGLGFDWTTTAPIIYFYITLEYIFIRNKKMKLYEYFILEIINIFFYSMTDSRMSFLLLSLSIFCFFLLSNIRYIERFIMKVRKIFIFLPSVIAVFSIFIHTFYQSDSRIWNKLNILLSNRLALGNSAIKKYGIKLWGQNIKWVGYSYKENSGVYNYVDCSYLQILLEYGIVFLLICVLMYSYILYKAYQENNIYLCCCIIIILVFSITEPRLLNLMYNPFPLLAVSYLRSKERGSKNVLLKDGIVI